MARTLANLRADVRGLAGLTKATPDEVDALINEAHKELCVRAEWTRANLELGPTVAEQAAYAVPPNVERILSLTVDSLPLAQSSEQEVARIIQGSMRLRAYGIYWLSFDADGAESVSLYPTPGENSVGRSLIARAVVTPALLEEDEDPTVVPDSFDRGIRDYVASIIYGYVEDNPELRGFHEEQFERQVERLRRLRNSRAGRGGVRMRIEGVTA